MSDQIRRVAIVGGTHGNELTGVYLVKKFEQCPQLIQRASFQSMTLLANPEAIRINRRYLDRDLNRCFAIADLQNSNLNSYEDRRAKAIAAQLGPKVQPNVDVIFDLHSTTANMGLTILPSSRHPFQQQLSAYLSDRYPTVRICYGVQSDQDAPMLRSLTPLGFTLEIGAIAQGILDAQQFQQTEMLIYAILDYLDAYNRNELPPLPSHWTYYQAIAPVDYPRNAAGELQAMVHPQLQFQDYQPLHPGDPMFLTFTGNTISYAGHTTVFPVFINEAAYYEKGIAMILTQKEHLRLDQRTLDKRALDQE